MRLAGMETGQAKSRSERPDDPAFRRTWSWRRREGLKEYEGDIDLETLELLSPEPEGEQDLEIDPNGLSSQEAYKRLQQAIREEIVLFNLRNNVHWVQDLWNVLKCTYHSSISWISLAFLVFEVLAMFVTYIVTDTQRLHLPLAEGILVLLITASNLFLCVREERLRRTEMVRCTQNLLDSCDTCCSWMPSDYVDPCIPSSPSISLTCTFRDKELVSVPSNLLVKGDIVVLAPSHSAPAQVQQLVHGQARDFQLILEKGELLGSPDNYTTQAGQSVGEAKATSFQPSPREKFVVTKTPFKEPLRKILKNSTRRPASVLENERHYIVTTVIEKRLLPVVMGASLVVNVLRYLFLEDNSGDWSEMFLLLQSYAILPIMPLAFPLIWLCLNMYGAARIKALFDKVKNNSEDSSYDLTNALSTDSENGRKAIASEMICKTVSIWDVLPYFWNNLMGDPSSLPHTANLLQGFGNVTVWCCVDKEGILSLPNPSVEKVFFLRTKKSKHKERKHGRARSESSCTWESDSAKGGEAGPESSSDEEEDDEEEEKDEDGAIFVDDKEWENNRGHSEVYNLSNDPQRKFGLQFDDIRWKHYLDSLKPLGLNILLNASCSSPVRSLQLADHTGHLSLSHNPTVLPTTRRCLCLLGKEIGFMERALELFAKEQYIFAVQSCMNPKTPFPAPHSHPVLSICREKPVPHMACLVVKELNSGALQLLTQGSADMVMDACSDFWDGKDLCVLTGYERKKILDFYQRTNMSACSVAFSYKPISKMPADRPSGDVYLEVPPMSNWTYSDSDTASGVSIASDDEDNSSEKDFDVGDLKPDIDGEKKIDYLLTKGETVEDVDSYQRIIGGQIFIGMVSLQYQAKKDTIPFVEDLNTAGVRFVHFSSENELRSRVFAERMGLETGWNCHISLSDHGGIPEGTSTATSSERIGESLGDVTVGEDADQEGQTDAEDPSHKHVSWVDVKVEMADKVGGRKESKQEELLNPDPDGLTSSQVSAVDDYWFFSNRAKLPRGIQNIRPHLQDVDNVPLLVPLFTDCTAPAVQEMIAIMQENGEVVNCAGSSLNCSNTDIFTQADMSVIIEPLFPQVCLKGQPKDFRSGTPLLGRDLLRTKVRRKCDEESGESAEEISPLELSSLLNGLPCSLAFHRDVDFKFTLLLQEARQICCGVRNCFTYMLSCQLMLCFVMLLSYLVLLPPPLTGLHLLWFTCIIVPMISLSLIGTTVEWPTLMTMMTAKNDRKFEEITIPFAFYFCLGFLPTAFVCCVLVFPLTLWRFCCDVQSSPGNCHFLFGSSPMARFIGPVHRASGFFNLCTFLGPVVRSNSSNLWMQAGTSESRDLALAQDVNAFFLAIFCVAVSAGFVHRLHLLWQKSPFVNKAWFCSASSVVLLQVLYFAISNASGGSGQSRGHGLADLPSDVIAIVLVWPLLALFISELLKRRYIKFWIRVQKRAKLKFGTKLGMNSPF